MLTAHVLRRWEQEKRQEKQQRLETANTQSYMVCGYGRPIATTVWRLRAPRMYQHHEIWAGARSCFSQKNHKLRQQFIGFSANSVLSTGECRLPKLSRTQFPHSAVVAVYYFLQGSWVIKKFGLVAQM